MFLLVLSAVVGEVKSHFHESERRKELNGQKIRPEMSIKRGN